MKQFFRWFARPGRGPNAVRYGLALVLVVVALFSRLGLDPLIGLGTHPYATFYVAVALASALLGTGPALVVLVLGLLASLFFVVPPRGSPAVHGLADYIEIFLYLFVTSTIVALIDGLHKARRRTAEHAQALQQKQNELEADIAARLSAEEALRESEQRFRSLAEQLQDAVWLTSPDLERVLYVNPAYARLWGHDTADFYRDSHDWLAAVHPEDSQRVRHLFETGALSGRFEIEYRLLRQDGSVRWIRGRGFPIETEGARVVCAARIAEDITARKEIEQARVRNNEELERVVQERTSRLRETIAELEHFSYALVHDMRAPLRAMRGYTSLLQEAYPRGEAHEFCQRIMAAAERLDMLICDSLNYAKVARTSLPTRAVELGPLLDGLLTTYPNLLPFFNHIKIEAPMPAVLGNEAGLTECFSNLLGNAVKFVAPGENPEVRVWAEWREGMVRINVQDHGIGIPTESQHRLFKMFQRLTSTYEGTGVGLAIVQKAAERMGGRVGVQSALGKGSCFWIELRPAPGARKTAMGARSMPVVAAAG